MINNKKNVGNCSQVKTIKISFLLQWELPKTVFCYKGFSQMSQPFSKAMRHFQQGLGLRSKEKALKKEKFFFFLEIFGPGKGTEKIDSLIFFLSLSLSSKTAPDQPRSSSGRCVYAVRHIYQIFISTCRLSLKAKAEKRGKSTLRKSVLKKKRSYTKAVQNNI